MKMSVDWLNSYLERPVDADEVDRTLTNQGLPIESRLPVGDAGDEMLDVEVTSNRADCLSHLGLARDVAAGMGCGWIEPDHSLANLEEADSVETLASVVNEDRKLCPCYTARVIQGVRVGPSPEWLVRRLTSVGLRSVNNVVDVTNFVLLELGQPLHAFDLDLLKGRRVVVRKAHKGETMVALDGSECRFDNEMLVIADQARPVAVAGVMGGIDTAVTEKTTTLLLESAMFDAVSVRRCSRALKLASDSSFRFERGVDPLGVEAASRRAAKLICEITGGHLAKGVIRVGEPNGSPRSVEMHSERCNRLLGLRLVPKRMVQLLDRLGFAPTFDDATGRITCMIPTRRMDVQREVDLIEEVARLHGYDEIPVQERIHIVARPVQRSVEARKILSQVLVAHGYHEAITFSFIRPKFGEVFLNEGQQPVTINESQRRVDSMLRPSLLPSLLQCRRFNQDVGNATVRLFECASTWTTQQGQIIETVRLGLVSDADEPQLGLQQVRGSIEELVVQLVGRCDMTFLPSERANLSPAAQVVLEGKPIGWVGVIDSSCQKLFELQTPVVVAEIDLEDLLRRYPPQHQVGVLPKFPGIGRDLSVIVDESVAWGQIQTLVTKIKPELMEDLVFIGFYRGKPIPKGKKSISFRLLFRDPTATLRHEHVDGQMATVVNSLQTQIGAELRR